jgi:hypothetical protein
VETICGTAPLAPTVDPRAFVVVAFSVDGAADTAASAVLFVPTFGGDSIFFFEFLKKKETVT